MPTVRRISNPQGQRVPTPRRRQAAQQAMMKQRQAQQRQIQREPERDNGSAPILLKILSWLGIILLCFVLGYLGTSWVVEFLNKKLLLKPENRIENQEDLSNFETAEQERTARELLNSGANVKQVSLNLYHIKDGTLAGTRQNFVMRTDEENISDAVTSILSLSGVPNAEKIKLLHVFKNSETAFLDMSGQFVPSLQQFGQQNSLLLITGIVKTLQENFSPLSQVRFLIDSKQPNSNGVINLSTSWRLPNRS